MLLDFSAGLETYEGLETQYLQLFDAHRVFSWAGNIRGFGKATVHQTSNYHSPLVTVEVT